MNTNDALPISAVVVSHNEGHLLGKCLESVLFCQEIIFIDLESSDHSLTIAQKYATKCLSHPKVPVVEQIRKQIAPETKFDWILFIDPDEQIDPSLAIQLKSVFADTPLNTGAISVPWLFYFKNKPLQGTFWGHHNSKKIIIINRQHVIIPTDVHHGYMLSDKTSTLSIDRKGRNVLHHYWMSSWNQLFCKHRRYLKLEGIKQYKQGNHYSLKKQLKSLFTEFYDSYIIFQGYRDGLTGFWLSAFRSWYVYQSWSSLKRYENSLKDSSTN